MGLPESYNPVIINFDASPTDQLNFEHVVTHLLNEETRQNSFISGIQATDDEAYPANMRCIARTEIVCYWCDTKGHIKMNCPE
jgi:hypothetical protein